MSNKRSSIRGYLNILRFKYLLKVDLISIYKVTKFLTKKDRIK